MSGYGFIELLRNICLARANAGLWCLCERFVRSNLVACEGIASSQRTLLATTLWLRLEAAL